MFVKRIFLVMLAPILTVACTSTSNPDWGYAVTQSEPKVTSADDYVPYNTPKSSTDPATILNFVYLLRAYDQNGNEIGQGSAFLSSGKIVTNAHVVADAAWVEVFSSDGEHISTAPYAIYSDPKNDLVILPFPGNNEAGLPVDKQIPTLGTDAWAYGAPMGLQNTVSKGIVSNLQKGDGGEIEAVQISTPISPGSSGGPILNNAGKVIGVAVAVLEEGQNLNFAVPASKIPSLGSLSLSPIQFPSASDISSSDPELSGQQVFALYAAIKSQPLQYGSKVDGRFLAEEKVGDYFMSLYSFDGMAGREVKFGASSNVDATLVLFDSSWFGTEEGWGREDSNSGLGNYPYLHATLPSDGQYFLAVVTKEEVQSAPFTLWSGSVPESVALGDRWELLTGNTGNEMYLDLLSRTSEGYGAMRANSGWFFLYYTERQEIKNGSYKLAMYQTSARCGSRKIKIGTFRYKLYTGWEDDSSVSYYDSVIPGSVGEMMYDSLCQP